MKFETELHFYNYVRKILKVNGFSELDLLTLGWGFKELCEEVYRLEINDGDTLEKIRLHRPTKVFIDGITKMKDYNVQNVLEYLMNMADIFTWFDRVAKDHENEPEAYEILYKLYGKLDFQQIKRKIGHIGMLEETCGIYFLYTADKTLVYIGESTNLGSRLPVSIKERSNQINQEIVYCRIAPVLKKPQLDIYESYYISKLKPECNTIGIYDGELDLELPELDLTDFIEVYTLLETESNIV